MKDNLIWNEKYRPHSIYKIINQDIKNIIQANNLENLPHLLLYGPSGTGKTTTALTLCHHLYNNNNKYYNIYNKIINERVLELNASDERGIKTVREKIKLFASQNINKYENMVSFKIIILDEADAMTNDSQFALRRIIEQYSYISRFILICNYVTKIISPLSSRFYKLKFNSFDKENIINIITNIINNENINYNHDELNDICDIIINYTDSDVRKIITLLQRINFVIKINNNNMMNIDIIKNIIGIIPDDIFNNLYNDLFINSNHNNISILIKDILNNGYSYNELLKKLSNCLIVENRLSEKKKSLIYLKISEICYNLSNGSDEYIQLITLFSYIKIINL